MDNNYYYGPYGFHGGAYMYNDAWDDYYDHREDAREDWQDHREDLGEERTDRAETDRNSGPSAPARPRSSARTVNRRGRKIGLSRRRNEPRRPSALRPRARRHRQVRSGRTGSAEARGYGDGSRTQAAKPTQRSGGSDAFSGYGNGGAARSSGARGQQSRGSSRGGGGRRR